MPFGLSSFGLRAEGKFHSTVVLVTQIHEGRALMTTGIDLYRSERRYAGGMRIIEALQYGVDLADTLNDLAAAWQALAGTRPMLAPWRA